MTIIWENEWIQGGLDGILDANCSASVVFVVFVVLQLGHNDISTWHLCMHEVLIYMHVSGNGSAVRPQDLAENCYIEW